MRPARAKVTTTRLFLAKTLNLELGRSMGGGVLGLWLGGAGRVVLAHLLRDPGIAASAGHAAEREREVVGVRRGTQRVLVGHQPPLDKVDEGLIERLHAVGLAPLADRL